MIGMRVVHLFKVVYVEHDERNALAASSSSLHKFFDFARYLPEPAGFRLGIVPDSFLCSFEAQKEADAKQGKI
ncbi:MAG: hypothetical protein Q8N65_03470 [bacterium]|nr:hypothetical protein [bacterium]